MTDDREALVSEIQRLLRVNRRWRAVAIAALAMVFVVLIPFTMSFWWLVRNRESRDMEQRARVAQQALQHAEALQTRKGKAGNPAQ
jgi:uncharacterized membrane protein YdfJ with MMPL/SSD domain